MIAFSRPLLVATGLVLLPAAALAADPATATLTLSADGVVSAAPDMAIVSLGVVKQADTADEALSANNKAMQETLAALKEAGVDDKDIATSSFAIDPVMVYPPQKDDGSQDAPKITGYRVSNAVTVKLRDITQAGGLLDKVIRVGANDVRGVSFTVDNQDSLMDEARVEAMKTLETRAELYAKTGGFTLKRILSISEGGADTPPVPMMMAKMTTQAEAVPFMAGQQDIRATVHMTWEIEPATK
ncbi:SIMPL domain-containing protein [Pleomorphomonas sp. JP5]|uniref:SIMPL domain-containing protein n=1 Tax=Pleomorphomonas sp. JP5 TaxID=2942998 RepID=UPI0020430576|nr:SIMPL domain-containing protein [Pleomorphomonas sp. JP5]MCM5557594.1 SIMPL domain-containing protein [Pleomorphomonas sp. JP5]